MAQPNVCDGCSYAHTCREVPGQLGSAEGPSVASKVVIAFLLPLVMFIVALGVFDGLLEETVAGPYQTPLALVLALSVTATIMLVVRILVRARRRK
jgi:hypothetical protein